MTTQCGERCGVNAAKINWCLPAGPGCCRLPAIGDRACLCLCVFLRWRVLWLKSWDKKTHIQKNKVSEKVKRGKKLSNKN
jgi:hypothetical protein